MSDAADHLDSAVLELVADAAEIGRWDWNRETGEVWWDTWHARLLGDEPTAGHRTYAEFRERVHPDDIEPLERDIQRSIETGTLYQSLYRVVLPDGTVRHMRGQGRVLEDQPSRMVGVLVDITPSVDAAERERDLLRTLHEADRRARLSFAADIHDGPLQRLFAAHLSASGAIKALGASGAADVRVLARLERCVDAIQEAQVSLRALLTELHHDSVDGLVDVFEHLHHLAHEVFDGRDERIHVVRSAPVSLADALLPEVLHIAREAMQNIVKHAAAHNVTVQVTATDELAVIEITDDGVGFDGAPAAAKAGHYGLRTMAHRAAAIGGSVTTISTPGAGTTIVLELPLA